MREGEDEGEEEGEEKAEEIRRPTRKGAGLMLLGTAFFVRLDEGKIEEGGEEEEGAKGDEAP
jgi:hypothetical protein